MHKTDKYKGRINKSTELERNSGDSHYEYFQCMVRVDWLIAKYGLFNTPSCFEWRTVTWCTYVTYASVGYILALVVTEIRETYVKTVQTRLFTFAETVEIS